MALIAFRLFTLIAIAYLFGLLVAWLFSLFDDRNGGDDFRDNDPKDPTPPKPGKTHKQVNPKKRLVEVDESYYLEEFDLTKKK